MPKWKKHNEFNRVGPNISPAEEVADYDRVPTVIQPGVLVPGGKATDLKVAGQNTPQSGTGKLSGRNFLGHRVT